ncbi:ABC transporter permease [Clostridium sp. LP20]|uniref:ABC transporter permease n=1 Tax=Clostridium sp. LP20 TaxID=3418665 RepID=UPI003EE72ED1
MGLVQLTIVNIKRYAKNPMILLMSFVLPVIMLVGMIGTEGSKPTIGIIDKDNSEYSEKIIEDLKVDYKVYYYTGEIESNYKEIRDKNVGAIYVIDKGFEDDIKSGRVPIIESYKSEEVAGSMLAEKIIDKFIKGELEEGIEEGLSSKYIETTIEKDEKSDNGEYLISLLMICYFMVIGGSIITEDMIKLKVQKVLKRAISTSNSDKEILGGMFMAAFFIQGVLSSLAFIVTSKILKVPNINIPQSILVIGLCSLFTTALVVLVTRYIKNANFATLLVVLIGLVYFTLAIVNMNLGMFENIPSLVTKLGILSPFYWMIEIINNGRVLPAIVIISLISLVFFTAGSFKLREFVKE